MSRPMAEVTRSPLRAGDDPSDAAVSAPDDDLAAEAELVGARRAARPVRGVVAVRAETGEKQIAGLTPCGKYQELCKAEIPTKIPR